MINHYTPGNHNPPESLKNLVKSGYLSGSLPVDPFSFCALAVDLRLGRRRAGNVGGNGAVNGLRLLCSDAYACGARNCAFTACAGTGE